jgi:hypothetical protein
MTWVARILGFSVILVAGCSWLFAPVPGHGRLPHPDAESADGDLDVDEAGDTGDADHDATDADAEAETDPDAEPDRDIDTDGVTDSDPDSDPDVEDACVPSCIDRQCGSDGCGGNCRPGCGASNRCMDGVCSGSCDPNSGFGTSCTDAGMCSDGSQCFGESSLLMYGALCVPSCGDSAPCPDVAPGREACLNTSGGYSYCFVLCLTADDCPCGMSCRTSTSGRFICYP